MKCGFSRYWLVFLLVLSAASLTQAQTKADLQTQVNPPVVFDATVIVVLPGVGFVPVRLDSSLELYSTTPGGMFLRAKTTNIVFKDDFFKVVNPQTVFSTTANVVGGKNNLMVFFNGLLQREVEDYNVAQETSGFWTVTFKNQIPTGSYITIKYPVN